MPSIDIKLAKQASRKQEIILAQGLANAITMVPGKKADTLMVRVSSDDHLYMGGQFLEYGAMATVSFKSGVTQQDCEAFQAEFARILVEELKIPEKNIYITYEFCDTFAVGAKFI